MDAYSHGQWSKQVPRICNHRAYSHASASVLDRHRAPETSDVSLATT